MLARRAAESGAVRAVAAGAPGPEAVAAAVGFGLAARLWGATAVGGACCWVCWRWRQRDMGGRAAGQAPGAGDARHPGQDFRADLIGTCPPQLPAAAALLSAHPRPRPRPRTRDPRSRHLPSPAAVLPSSISPSSSPPRTQPRVGPAPKSWMPRQLLSVLRITAPFQCCVSQCQSAGQAVQRSAITAALMGIAVPLTACVGWLASLLSGFGS